MTLENSKKLLKHYEAVAKGEGIDPLHAAKTSLMAKAAKDAENIKENIARRELSLKYPGVEYDKIPVISTPKAEPKVEAKPEVKAKK